MTILSLRDLLVHFRTEDGVVKAVDGLSFDLRRRTTLGIVGESGSGKSVATMAILGLHDRTTTTVGGRILFEGTDLAQASERTMHQYRGKRISMIFQDPLTALSPYYTIGDQIVETYRRHTGASRKRARARAIEMLGKVGIPQPQRRADDYPHQFSGGMRQRAMIAIALCCDPDLLIADEPTTALDVTVQAQILDLLRDLQQEFNTAIILITHDMGVVAQMADEVLVMYAGRGIERGGAHEVLRQPRHPYSWGLLSSIPHLGGDVEHPLTPVRGTPPSLIDVPPGCPFHPRCDYVTRVDGARCETERPQLVSERSAACHLADTAADRIFGDEIRPKLSTGKAS
ncbi:ABC transporter ATP-binding protein [Nocardia panacis]|uniref:ABC transporter ATP-binding protein n=1 Tax=Nocardia panacis TaxID=2340916 RepID=A0A3A4KV56_9NOCA|nr:ABC transporter ATP-binding protein [Nocardia panacis]RJO73744.1 ABC transporter ATP-binding protein [Nocardia panacis]